MVERRDIARGQATLGPDEFLNNIPGVYVQNRYNFSQGQRIEIRGAGARENFGFRGIKSLLDGRRFLHEVVKIYADAPD